MIGRRDAPVEFAEHVQLEEILPTFILSRAVVGESECSSVSVMFQQNRVQALNGQIHSTSVRTVHIPYIQVVGPTSWIRFSQFAQDTHHLYRSGGVVLASLRVVGLLFEYGSIILN